MNEDFSELIEYLDKKFGKVDSDFKELKENFNLLLAEKLGIKLEY